MLFHYRGNLARAIQQLYPMLIGLDRSKFTHLKGSEKRGEEGRERGRVRRELKERGRLNIYV